MSFSSILSSADPDTTGPGSLSPRASRKTPRPASDPQPPQNEPPHPISYSTSLQPLVREVERPVLEEVPPQDKIRNSIPHTPPPPQRAESKTVPTARAPNIDKIKVNGEGQMPKAQPLLPRPKPKIVITEKELQAALAKIDALEFSDVEDTAGLDRYVETYAQRRGKRSLEICELEDDKRKVWKISMYTLLLG